jgi:hypothetical protein
MPLQPPDVSVITSVAENYGLGLSKADVASFAPLVKGVLQSWDAVEELHNQVQPEVHSGPGFARSRRTTGSVRGTSPAR